MTTQEIITEEKIFTWDDLAQEISRLSPEQRNAKVFMAIDDDGQYKIAAGIGVLEDDIYLNKEDFEDGGSLKDLQDLHGNDFNIDEYFPASKKGTAFLFNDF